jgi:hypothetical protein
MHVAVGVLCPELSEQRAGVPRAAITLADVFDGSGVDLM